MTAPAPTAESASQLPAPLLEDVYGSVGDEQPWPTFLGRLARVFDADTAFVQEFDLKRRRATGARGHGFDDQLLRDYPHFSASNVWMIQGAHLVRPGGITLSHEMYPEDLLARTEFYAVFLRPAGIFYSLGTVLDVGDHVSVTMSVQRRRGAGSFEQAEQSTLGALSPHLRNAYDLHRRLRAAECRAHCLEDALDAQVCAVLLVGRGCRVVHANHAGRRLLASRSGLLLTPQGLAAPLPPESADLRRLVESAVAAADGNGQGAGGSIRLSQPACGHPLHVRVIPLVQRKRWLVQSEPLAVVFVSDPATPPRSGAELLRASWGLTPAEARLALLLVQGRTLAQAADELKVSIHTVRSQVKSLFAKTETRRQAELVLSLLATLEAGCEKDAGAPRAGGRSQGCGQRDGGAGPR